MLTIFYEARRFCVIIYTILIYGLDDLIPKESLTFLLRVTRISLFWIRNKHKKKTIGERLYLAIQQLGPVWIKLGQMLSTRTDLFPKLILNQLEKLQNQVQSMDEILARKQIERAMGGEKIESWFNDFQPKPLASASIAQVHAATLKNNGKKVIIKIIRQDVILTIKDDIRLIYRLVNLILKFFPEFKRFHLIEIVRDYNNSIMNELNLLRETANAIQFRRNFENSEILYIPEVYPEYCNENMMVMEYIYGISINNISDLKAQGTNMKLLAERGVQIFFTQVFRDSFFHGDMHPGNIFVSFDNPENPKYISVDFGIVGSLDQEDRRYIAENFIAFFNRDYRKVAELHLNSGLVPMDINMKDFEFAIRTICEPIFKKPLSKISFANLLLNFFKTAQKFNVTIQPQLLMLQKTLLYVEGVGKKLYPNLNLWETAKPFLEKWIKRQTGMSAIFRTLKRNSPYLSEQLLKFPALVYDCFKKHRELQKSIDDLIISLNTIQVRKMKIKFLFFTGIILLFNGILLFIVKEKIDVLQILLISIGILSLMISWKYISSSLVK